MPSEAELEATRKRLWAVTHAFQRWLHLPDPSALHIAIATVVANRMDGDPVWLLLVGAPGSAKTEILNTIARFPDVHETATFTEAALLSGTPSKDWAKKGAAKGGLLREIGEFGIILCKDFGSVLSMGQDARSALLAALREVFDGSWTRRVGSEGGRSLEWKGKVGFVGAATPMIDQHHSVMGAMGERFMFFRMPPTDRQKQAKAAVSVGARASEMRAELARDVNEFLEAVRMPNGTRYLDPGEEMQLVALADLATRCRSEVVRDRYHREIELIPEAEYPARLAKILAQTFEALLAIGVDRDGAWRLVSKLAVDSGPRDRWRAMAVVLTAGGPLETPAVCKELGLPNKTTHRLLEDLTAHGLLACSPQGPGRADLWLPSKSTRALVDQAALEFERHEEGVGG